MGTNFDPVRLSRELAAVAERLERARAALQGGRLHVDPFLGRAFPGKTLFDEVKTLHPEDPLRRPLLRWVAHLTDERIQWPWLVGEVELLRVERHPLTRPVEAELTLAELDRQALTAPAELRRELFEARGRAAGRLGAHRRNLLERRVEVTRRLGLEGPSELWGPTEEPGAARELASVWLGASQGASDELGVDDFSSFVEVGLGWGASEGWPARLSPDTCIDLVGRSLFRGVQLAEFPLPSRVAPSSFLRALAALGVAWRRALARKDLPFVVARDPRGLEEKRSGVAWALVARRALFARRRLGLGRVASEAHARALTRVLFLEARRRAAVLLAREAALSGARELEHEARARSLALFRREWSGEEWLGRFESGVDADTDFVALLSAVAREAELVEEFDEDYFDSPRAHEKWRDEASLPPALTAPRAQLERGMQLLLEETNATF